MDHDVYEPEVVEEESTPASSKFLDRVSDQIGQRILEMLDTAPVDAADFVNEVRVRVQPKCFYNISVELVLREEEKEDVR